MENQPLTNDLQSYIGLSIRWAWLLILGLALGTVGAYFYSRSQLPIYEASTKILVLQGPQALPLQNETVVDLSSISEGELIQTYMELLTTRAILDLASERLGFGVGGGQIRPQQVGDTSIIRLTVQDSQPQKAAMIANTLSEILIKQNEVLQASRFADSEQSLQAQLEQIQAQIDSVEEEIVRIQEAKFSGSISLENLQAQVAQLRERFEHLEAINATTREEIIQLESKLEQFARDGIDYRGRNFEPLPQDEIDYLRAELQRLALVLDLPDETVGSNQFSDDPQLVRLEESLRIYQQMYSEALGNYETVRLARTRNTPSVVQVEDAQPPGQPIQPQPVRFALIGAIAGLIIAGGIAFLVEYLDDTLHLPDEVTRELGLPVLGIISKHDNQKQPVTISEPRSPVSEAFRSLRTNIQNARENGPLKTILVTSSMPEEGKTTVVVNMAVAMAQNGYKVLLLDADLRRPKIHKLLGINNGLGFSEMLTSEQSDLKANIRSTATPGLSALTSGTLPPNPAELLGSIKMSKSLQSLTKHYDLVLLDIPPALAVTDASVIAPLVDGVVLVIKPGETKRGSAYQAVEQLNRVGANIIGVVLNDVVINRSGYNDYYKRYYSAYNRYYSDEVLSKTNGKEPRLRKKISE